MELKDKIKHSKAIFFDLFHTLFSVVTEKSAIRTGGILGIPDDIWTQMLFESSDSRLRGIETDKYAIIRELAHQYNPDIPEEIIRQAADCRQKRFHDCLSNLKTDKVNILKKLKAAGKKIGLISNADAVEISGWNHSPFSPYFDCVIFSYQIGYVKPEVEIYQHALDKLDVSAADSIFIGDGSCNELSGARKIGMTTVITTEFTSTLWPEKIPERSLHADYIIDDFEQLNCNF